MFVWVVFGRISNKVVSHNASKFGKTKTRIMLDVLVVVQADVDFIPSTGS